jgi:hypothetical protein
VMKPKPFPSLNHLTTPVTMIEILMNCEMIGNLPDRGSIKGGKKTG